jgi:hypothetical protein
MLSDMLAGVLFITSWLFLRYGWNSEFYQVCFVCGDVVTEYELGSWLWCVVWWRDGGQSVNYYITGSFYV